MSYEAWVTVAVLASVLVLLVSTRRAPDFILVGGLTLLMVFPRPGDAGLELGVLPVKLALSGFANEGLLAVAGLFVVAEGLKQTGTTQWLAHAVLGRPATLTGALVRLMVPTSVMSAFMNNTPLVAMLLPVVDDWARQRRFSVSKLMLPLSYAGMLGGTCTLVGTSTNLVVNGWLVSHTGAPGLGMFSIARVGLPCAIVGTVFVLATQRWLLPVRKPVLSTSDDAREYTVEMAVTPGGALSGKTIEGAGLRHLPGLFLTRIYREDEVIAAVSPTVVLRDDDRLVFAGIVESVKDLQKIRGLMPATKQVHRVKAPRSSRSLAEVVVSESCPLIGRSIREGGFRARYNAAIIAVARNGERIRGVKIGDIVLQPGDTLLLEAPSGFAERHRNRRDFYLASTVEDSAIPRHDRAGIAIAIVVAMVGAVALGWIDMLKASFVAGLAMVATRCCTAESARRAIDWRVLLVIAGAIGIGESLRVSGFAQLAAERLIEMVGVHPWLVLAAIFVLTMVFTATITNNAAALLTLPIAYATAEQMQISPMPFVVAIMIAASASFATPMGYQTNLMVYGPGGYRFGDYLRLGLPLSTVVFGLSMLLIPAFWSF